MQKTNIIGASLALVDRFAHLDQAELTKIEDDAGKWYLTAKDKVFDSTTGQQKDKPNTLKERFVWLSEQWWFRIIIGLFFTLIALPWARKRAKDADQDEPRRGATSGRTSRYDADGFDRQGFDRDGFDADGFDRDGIDRDGYDEDGDFVDFDDDDDDEDDDD